MKYQQSKIKTLVLGTSNTCNLKCPLCMRRDMTPEQQKEPELDLEKFKKFILRERFWFDLDLVNIMGTLSEPLYYTKLKELILFLKKEFPKVKIQIRTNGTQKFWDLPLNKKDEIFIAIDGYYQKQHSKYRINSQLKDIEQNIKDHLQKGKAKLIAFHIKFEWNYKDTNKVKLLCQEMGFVGFYEIYTGLSLHGEFMAPGILKPTDNRRRDLQFKLMFQKIKDSESINSDTILDSLNDGYGCLALRPELKSLYINHKNQINICDAYDEDLYCTDEEPITMDLTFKEIYTRVINKKPKKQCTECNFNNKRSKMFLKEIQDVYTEF